jgi:hypothetical protein
MTREQPSRPARTDADPCLWAPSLVERLRAARRYRLFPENVDIPRRWQTAWRRVADVNAEAARLVWTADMDGRFSNWEQHAFGTANAAVLLLWDRPGPLSDDKPDWIDPRVPNLGGVPHAHVRLYRELIKPNSTGWRNIQTDVGQGLSGIAGFDALSMLMVACLNPVRGDKPDLGANREAMSRGGRIQRIIQAVQPMVVLVCGDRSAIQDAVREHERILAGAAVLYLHHPRAWETDKRRHGRRVVLPFMREWVRTGSVPDTRPFQTAAEQAP